jgi:hypothetical protein
VTRPRDQLFGIQPGNRDGKRVTFYTAPFLQSRTETDENGCWIWQGAKNAAGYGLMRPNQTGSAGAHRVMFILLNGQIPDGVEINHKCYNRACINPFHLELVTHLENVRRGKTHYAVRDACIHGHLYIEGSFHIDTRGSRVCNACHEIQKKKDYAKQKARRQLRLVRST